MKKLCVLLMLPLAACGGKTHLVPQAYMSEPPSILMQPPKELHTIKQKTNLTVDANSVTVNPPKGN